MIWYVCYVIITPIIINITTTPITIINLTITSTIITIITTTHITIINLTITSTIPGVACLIHYAKMNVLPAIAAAKQLRPIIDPIGQLPEFLHR